jgi:hypothetical protein
MIMVPFDSVMCRDILRGASTKHKLRLRQLFHLEVTKATMKKITGDITVAHTTADIDRHSVTSMYEVGIGLGLIDSENDMVYY